MKESYTAILEKSATGFGTYIPNLPGCVAVATTPTKSRALIHEAAELHVASMRAHNEPIPAPTSNAYELSMSA